MRLQRHWNSPSAGLVAYQARNRAAGATERVKDETPGATWTETAMEWPPRPPSPSPPSTRLSPGRRAVSRHAGDTSHANRSSARFAFRADANRIGPTGLGGPRPMARSNASTAPCSTNGLSSGPTPQTPYDRQRFPTGWTGTTTADPTSASAAKHQPAAPPTCPDNTPRPCYERSPPFVMIFAGREI
jgi:hypothetical protein